MILFYLAAEEVKEKSEEAKEENKSENAEKAEEKTAEDEKAPSDKKDDESLFIIFRLIFPINVLMWFKVKISEFLDLACESKFRSSFIIKITNVLVTFKILLIIHFILLPKR